MICQKNVAFHQLFSHYPSFVIDVKNAIGDGNVKNLVDEIKQAEVLILDDIGAEQSTPWVRDEILQVVLQYRMQKIYQPFYFQLQF